jgi:hypothetical protein
MRDLQEVVQPAVAEPSASTVAGGQMVHVAPDLVYRLQHRDDPGQCEVGTIATATTMPVVVESMATGLGDRVEIGQSLRVVQQTHRHSSMLQATMTNPIVMLARIGQNVSIARVAVISGFANLSTTKYSADIRTIAMPTGNANRRICLTLRTPT